MELMKSADDTVRYSITAFCHVCHLYTKAISALKFGGAWMAGAGWSGPRDVRALVSVLWCKSLLPKDTLLGAYLKPLKFVADKECSNVMPKLFLHLVGTHKYSLSKTIQSSRLNK